MTSLNGVINQRFFQNVSLTMMINFNHDQNFIKKQIKELKTAQIPQKVLFSLISYIKCLHKGACTEICLPILLPHPENGSNQGFSEAPDSWAYN